jgi:hypothetical protein
VRAVVVVALSGRLRSIDDALMNVPTILCTAE